MYVRGSAETIGQLKQHAPHTIMSSSLTLIHIYWLALIQWRWPITSGDAKPRRTLDLLRAVNGGIAYQRNKQRKLQIFAYWVAIIG